MRRPPKYCLHKARGVAYVIVAGKQVYLPGKYGSDESDFVAAVVPF